MKVLYDHQIFALQSYGGISRYYSELINYFRITRAAECSLSIVYPKNYYINSCGIFKPSYPFQKIGNLFSDRSKCSINRINSEIEIFKGSYDIFHPTYYDTYFLKRINKKPFVLTIYDMIHERYPELFPKTDKIAEYKRILASKATKIISISENTKKDILELYDIDEEKIEVIYLGSSMDRQSKTNDLSGIDGNVEIDSVLPGGLPKRFILFVGNRGSYKNFLAFINSIASILTNDDSLCLVCAGSVYFSAAELAYFDRLAIRNKIIHIPINDSILSYLYQKAIVFVFPSLYEGFGLPILESFSCGCPVALSDSSSFPEVAKDAAIYFDPRSKSSMEESILRIIYDERLRGILIKRGFDVLKDYSWEKTAQKTLDFYKDII